MKKAQLCMILVFVLLLAAGAVSVSIHEQRDYSELENRTLRQKPDFSYKKVLKGTYQKQYEAYLSDQFPGRDSWVDMAVSMEAVMGKKDINGVYLGRDGYLLEKSTAEETEKEQVEENINILSSFLNDMEKDYGKEHVSCLMVPSKDQAIPDRLPAFAQTEDRQWVVDTLKQKVFTPDLVFDLKQTMEAHQNEYIYYRTDHHWTTLGAFYAYQAWMQKMGAKAQPLEAYRRETVYRDFYGTTYNKVHVKVPADEVEVFHSKGEDSVQVNMDEGEKKAETLYFPEKAEEGFNRYDLFLSGNTFQIDITTGAHTGKMLLLVKDSFANCFVPFLTQDYDRIILIDYRYGKTAVGTLRSRYDVTDVMVLFNVDKFMKHTKLAKLAETKKRKQTLKEFNPEDFLG